MEMDIDGRKLDLQELLTRVRELLSSNRTCGLSVDILTETDEAARKVSAYVAMSGCKTKIDKINNHYIIHVTGIPCCT